MSKPTPAPILLARLRHELQTLRLLIHLDQTASTLDAQLDKISAIVTQLEEGR